MSTHHRMFHGRAALPTVLTTLPILLAPLLALGACNGSNGTGSTSGGATGQTRTLSFQLASQEIVESSGTTQIRIDVSSAFDGPVTLPFTVSGTATENDDFTIDSSPLTIAAGQTTAVIDLTLVDDDEFEGAETLTIGLLPPSFGTLTNVTEFTATIHDHELGGPLDGLTQDELDAFHRGKVQFERRFQPSEGLGPFYNATSCAACHSHPISGGASQVYRNFFLATYFVGTIANQGGAIGPGLSKIVPSYGTGPNHSSAVFALDGGRPAIPEMFNGEPVITAQRNAIPIFGTGLFEFISDATIKSNEDINDLNGDGISGRANTTLDGMAIGRFGVKAQVNNVELFTRGPLQNQMGITTDPLLGSGGIISLGAAAQEGSDPNQATLDDDGHNDPEMLPNELADLIAFTRFLGPPLPKTMDDAALHGKSLFTDLRCAACHIPELPSSRGPVRAYTDLLLHDMGPDLADNFIFGDVGDTTQEFRTQPLWGISDVGPYLPDGRAGTLSEAILLHGGEAQLSRNAFTGLSAEDQADLIHFLESL